VFGRIAQTIDRHRMFPPRRVGVAVSGGADSVCLLHILRELAQRYDLELSVLHVNHNLRGDESRGDVDFVRGLASQLNLPFHLRELDLSAARDNLEQAARSARLEFFRELLSAGALDRVALGHTRSDQAETVLFRFLRGSGSAGLAGIRPVTADGIVRPLIDVERSEVVDYLRSRNLTWREDSTNSSLDFARNRIRHQLLPQLARDWNPAIADTLAHTAEWALAEEAWWKCEIEHLAAEHLTERDAAILVRASALLALPLAASRRLVRHAIERVKGDLRGIDFGHITAVLAMASQPEGGAVRIPRVSVCRSFDWVCFATPASRPRWRVTPTVPGSTPLPGTQLLLSLEIVDNSETSRPSSCVYNSEMGCLDWNLVAGIPTLRNWLPGDHYQPVGTRGDEKLKCLFQQARVPVWERFGWPVLEVEERIVWSRRFGPAAWCAAGSHSAVILKVREVAC
jgi:tRNA(Ile)-lysidine synthase